MAGAAAHAASGYIVNSDDPSPRDFDSLHLLQLESGTAAKIGEARSTPTSAPFADIEGLAMSPGEVLFGIDDASKTLVVIDPQNGRATAVAGREGNTGLSRSSGFDFGLAFACNGELYASSDSRRSLYRIDTATGVATLVGSEGSLGAQITGLAGRYDGLYGIGASGDHNLYRIDTTTGQASVIGPLGAGLQFADAGLDFDAAGQLWGIADMAGVDPVPSIVVRIDPRTGAAERVSTTLSGVESLAIAAPVCTAPEGEPLPPAIPALGRDGLALLGLLIGLVSLVGLRRR